MANNLLNFFKRLFFNQRQEEDIDQKSQNLRLAMILKASKQRIWIYDMARRHYFYLSDSGKYEEVYNLVEFSRLFNRDDYEVLSQALVDVHDVALALAGVAGDPARLSPDGQMGQLAVQSHSLYSFHISDFCFL